MGKLILGVVVDILRHVHIQNLESGCVECTPTPARHLAILDSSEFVVLYPQICFEGLRGGEEPEDCRVSSCELSTFLVLVVKCTNFLSKQSRTHCRCTRHHPILQKRTPIRKPWNDTPRFVHCLSPFFEHENALSSLGSVFQ